MFQTDLTCSSFMMADKGTHSERVGKKGEQEWSEDDLKKYKIQMEKLNKTLDEVHLTQAKARLYSDDPKNAQMDMMQQMLDKWPEGPEKNKMKKRLEMELEARKEGEAEMKAKLQAQELKKAMCGGREEERYDDGDQSRVVGREVAKLEVQWKGGMDYHPANCSPWMRTLFFGDYWGMMEVLNNMSKAQVARQLELRESILNMNSVQHVLGGAKTFYSDKPAMLMEVSRFATIREVKRGHVRILQKLIELGANVSAKDMAGCAPLHHCFAGYGNATTTIMAELLLKAGADPNLQDRTGVTPLFLAVGSADLEGVKLLLQHGGDPDVQEFTDGHTPRVKAAVFPAVQRLISKAANRDMKEERKQLKEAAGGSLATCRTCGAGGGTRCAGCFLVHYCSPACQKKDWKKHRVSCKETRAKYKPAKLKAQTGVNFNFKSKQVTAISPIQKAADGQFVVKVQVPREEMTAVFSSSKKKEGLQVYNMDRTLMGFLAREGQQELYDQLERDVRDHGFQRYKAFYPAIFKKDAAMEGGYRLEINPEDRQPVETW